MPGRVQADRAGIWDRHCPGDICGAGIKDQNRAKQASRPAQQSSRLPAGDSRALPRHDNYFVFVKPTCIIT
jgi:hypothetical protein